MTGELTFHATAPGIIRGGTCTLNTATGSLTVEVPETDTAADVMAKLKAGKLVPYRPQPVSPGKVTMTSRHKS